MVHVKVWIHFFIGDTEGNNKWLVHYPGNKEGVKRPYCDCKCQFHDLSNPNPNCNYLTIKDINLQKKGNKRIKIVEFKHNITGLFLLMTFKMHRPKRIFHFPIMFTDHIKCCLQLLHSSGSGLITYMFESLCIQMGGGKDRDFIDKQHIQIYYIKKRQSE